MTSKQVMLMTLLSLLCTMAVGLTGCDTYRKPSVERLSNPYDHPRVIAVAPLRNESGSIEADGVIMADHLTRQFENAIGIHTVPVNRVLAAMEGLRARGVSNEQVAVALMSILKVDGLVAGTITAYDPYDPPKLGISVELFTTDRIEPMDADLIRQLSMAESSDQVGVRAPLRQYPVTRASGHFDASDPRTKDLMQLYASNRGSEQYKHESWRRYRISMDLYSEFVAYAVTRSLLSAERQRLLETKQQEKLAAKTQEPAS